MKVKVLDRQTLADIAMQEYGCIDALPVLAAANGISMTDVPKPGTMLECPETEFDRYLQSYAHNNEIKPATE